MLSSITNTSYDLHFFHDVDDAHHKLPSLHLPSLALVVILGGLEAG